MYLEPGEKPQDISAVRQKVFSFFGESKTSQNNQPNQIKFRNTLHNSFGAIRQENTWRPRLPFKHIFDDPKFLLSLERKKFRVINGLRSDFQVSSTIRNQFKSPKKKSKKQTTTYRPRVISQAQKFSETYNHASLNLGLNQNHRVSKTPYLNFNLHHLIKSKKNALMSFQSESKYPRKKGSNFPYYTSVLSQKIDKPNKSNQTQENLISRQGYRIQIKSAKTMQGIRSRNNKSMGQKRYQQQIKQ